jgi:ABC-type lipoprotein release transport system permease subunit
MTNPEIIVAAISLCGTLGGSLIGVVVSAKLTNYRIEQLEKKVDKHNNFAERIPLLEEHIKSLKQRLEELERTSHHA